MPIASCLQVGEGERGYLLELLLTKLRYAAVSPDPEGKPDAAHEGLQIIGMSATMPNVSAVAKWLGAQLFQTDFRCPFVCKSLLVSMCSHSQPFAVSWTTTGLTMVTHEALQMLHVC